MWECITSKSINQVIISARYMGTCMRRCGNVSCFTQFITRQRLKFSFMGFLLNINNSAVNCGFFHLLNKSLKKNITFCTLYAFFLQDLGITTSFSQFPSLGP